MEIVTLQRRPELASQIVDLHMSAWPAYIANNPSQHSERVLSELPEYQLMAVDDETVLVVVNAVVIAWNGTFQDLPASWYGCVDRTIEMMDRGETANTLVMLAIIVHPDFLGQGLSSKIIDSAKELARDKGLTQIILPIRPTWKPKYPLIPMDAYMHWKRSDGAPFDPWIRCHWRQGAKIMGVCQGAMTISDSLENWQEWTELEFQSDGEYIIPGGLCPLVVDTNSLKGRYAEDNVWAVYQISQDV